MLFRLNQINIRLAELKSKAHTTNNLSDMIEIIDLENERDELLFLINEEEQEYKIID